ncbi:peptidase [Oscillochloris sp. ZM17-4]|uniref:peptidase n=1 Tax=Oscillochloris sp. ZM17-4 TaxID=2866714 RepID=UPI00210510AF|nr:peptidase [Oscillochloris sp. ZM17-4]
MNSSSQLRNAFFAILIVLAILLGAQWRGTPVQAQGTGATLIVVTAPASILPGGTGDFVFRITNTSGSDRIFNLTTSATGGVTVIFPSGTQVSVADGSSADFTASVLAPSSAIPGASLTQTMFANSTTPTPSLGISEFFTVVVGGPTFTPTTTLTPTTGPATATRTPGPVCQDGFETDNSPAAARALDVNTAQQRAICPAGDEDWLVFGGVAGKVYTVDISRQDPGIDLTLEIFDKDLNSIAFNDDFYNRDPANPNPGDTKPRITIRIPFDGPYYIKVRDAAGRGGVNYIYDIALLDESYGPTPTLVREICLDLFEPDGLPEQARLITSNEIQENRRLCPTGDADWVVFFGKTGKRYIIFTDTRRYVGTTKVNEDAQAGADTVMVLTDRDGVSLLDVNDDIPGGRTLDSQIEFTPEVDGFYFVQIKNVGDIGNQFIRYDLTLKLCLPGQTDCGRGDASTTAPVQPITPQPTGTPASEFVLDPTNTPQPTATPTP